MINNYKTQVNRYISIKIDWNKTQQSMNNPVVRMLAHRFFLFGCLDVFLFPTPPPELSLRRVPPQEPFPPRPGFPRFAAIFNAYLK